MVLATLPFSVYSRLSVTASAGVRSRGSIRISSASVHHLPQPHFFCSCSVSRSTYLLLQWALRARFFMCTFCGRSHARLTCSVSPSKRTLPGCPFALPRHDFMFRLSGARAKRRQGFGCSQGERRLDIQTLCLQIEPPTGKRCFAGYLPAPPPLIIIAEGGYYKQDYKADLSFFSLRFSQLVPGMERGFLPGAAKGFLM